MAAASSTMDESNDACCRALSKIIETFDVLDHDEARNDQFRQEVEPLLVTSKPPIVDSGPDSNASGGNDEGQSVRQGQVMPDSRSNGTNGSITLDLVQQHLTKLHSQVSAQEREAAISDLHGIAHYPTEKDQVVLQRILEMDHHLSMLPDEFTTAYRLSVLIDPSFAANHDFRKMFLRADQFNAKRAAWRLARHFSLKLELFGVHMLVKRITLKDLDDDALKIIKSGFLEPLPIRDRSGRLILYGRAIPFSRVALMKAQWYAMMTAVEGDLISQVRGVVVAGYNLGSMCLIDHRAWRDMSFCVRATPIRIVAHHSLVQGKQNIAFVLNLKFHMVRQNRMRFHHYFDLSVEDYHRELRRFGMPMDAFVMRGRSEEMLVERTRLLFMAQQLYLRNQSRIFPLPSGDLQQQIIPSSQADEYSSVLQDDILTLSGQDSTEDVDSSVDLVPVALMQPPSDYPQLPIQNPANKPLPELSIGAESAGGSKRIRELGVHDVVFGRGQSRSSSGNVELLRKVQESVSAYRAADRRGKTKLADIIVQDVHDCGGRFLKLAEDEIQTETTQEEEIGGYVEVSPSMAREKVSRYFRRFTKKK